MSNGINGIYIPGPPASDNNIQSNDGYYVAGTGTISIPVGAGVNAVDTYSFFNNSSVPVRVVITLAAGIAPASVTGNLAWLAMPGHSVQESFSRSIIGGVTIDAVTLGVTTTPISGLTPDGVSTVTGVLKFIEN
jgi:hypothetical protein